MTTLEDAIVEWSIDRPKWQRSVMQRLARGEILTDRSHAEIAELLCQNPSYEFGPELVASDLPSGGGPSSGQVSISGIRGLAHVNALLADQSLDFSPTGLTVVYGDNGSGKSGYARLLKTVVRARHHEDVRTDIIADVPVDKSSAQIRVRIGTDDSEILWPTGDATALSAVLFYDEACGDKYVTTDSEVGYKPSVLSVLEGLVRTCDGVRAVLDQRLVDNARQAASLPELRPSTPSGVFVSQLSPASSVAALNDLCGQGIDTEPKIKQLSTEVERLRSIDPAKESAALQTAAMKLERVAAHVTNVSQIIGNIAETELFKLREGFVTAKVAADQASRVTFNDEPLEGVGSSSWTILWEAARSYARDGAQMQAPFPNTALGARCVLCHQGIDSEAGARLRRFEAFIKDNTQQVLNLAERQRRDALQKITSLVCVPPEILVLLDDIAVSHESLVTETRGYLATAELRRTGLVAAAGTDTGPAPVVPHLTSTVPPLADAAIAARKQALITDNASHKQHLDTIVQELCALEDAKKLASVRSDVVTEIARRDDRDRIEKAKAQTSTNGISSKIADLMRTHVTSVVRDRFTRETERLRLDRVTLNELGVKKGTLRQQAAFVGARQSAPLPEVLSEGEQTALGLAGFFTEAYLDQSCSGLILDDPVCSLDHGRRARVAERLVEFAKDRQVIVFTHDIAFVGEMTKAADAVHVSVAERSVGRAGSGKPGVCREHHPWKAKNVPQRLDELARDLAKIKTEQSTLEQEVYEQRTSDWAGKLSETWERIVAHEVVGHVFNFGKQEVRPQSFRLLAKITETDDREFQASYGRCSQWARRHDKSVEVNYVAPVIGDMEREFGMVKAWFERVKKYRN
jgi:energy-coupling factor transporter ATP-binding protein EcfA2